MFFKPKSKTERSVFDGRVSLHFINDLKRGGAGVRVRLLPSEYAAMRFKYFTGSIVALFMFKWARRQLNASAKK